MILLGVVIRKGGGGWEGVECVSPATVILPSQAGRFEERACLFRQSVSEMGAQTQDKHSEATAGEMQEEAMEIEIAQTER